MGPSSVVCLDLVARCNGCVLFGIVAWVVADQGGKFYINDGAKINPMALNRGLALCGIIWKEPAKIASVKTW